MLLRSFGAQFATLGVPILFLPGRRRSRRRYHRGGPIHGTHSTNTSRTSGASAVGILSGNPDDVAYAVADDASASTGEDETSLPASSDRTERRNRRDVI